MSSPQSRVFENHNVQVNVKAGVVKDLVFTMDFDIGDNPHHHAIFKVWKPGESTPFIEKMNTSALTNTVEFTGDREVTVRLVAGDNNPDDVGNWNGEIEFYNSGGVLTDHSFTFGYNILESP